LNKKTDIYGVQMTNWLCVVDNEETYNKCFENGSWGVRGKTIQTIKKVRINDMLIFYIKSKIFRGIFTVTKEYDKDISVEELGLYPDCVKFDNTHPKKLIDTNNIDFKEIFGKELSGFVRNPMHELSETEFETLEKILK